MHWEVADIYNKKCKACGEEFEAEAKQQVYCGNCYVPRKRIRYVDLKAIEDDRRQLSGFELKVREEMTWSPWAVVDMRLDLEEGLKVLDEEERLILEKSMQGNTQDEIAGEMDTYQQRIARILERALGKITTFLG